MACARLATGELLVDRAHSGDDVLLRSVLAQQRRDLLDPLRAVPPVPVRPARRARASLGRVAVVGVLLLVEAVPLLRKVCPRLLLLLGHPVPRLSRHLAQDRVVPLDLAQGLTVFFDIETPEQDELVAWSWDMIGVLAHAVLAWEL